MGLEPQWENRATAFALLSDDSGPHFPAIHSAVVEFLDNAPYRRIEATVDVGFKQGTAGSRCSGLNSKVT